MRREWSDGLLLPLLFAAGPLAGAGFVWLFHAVVPRPRLLAWLALIVVICVVGAWHGLRARRSSAGRRSLGRWGQLAVLAIIAAVFALPPWLIDAPRTTGWSSLALLYPFAALAVGVVILAPLRTWFLAFELLVAVPTMWWTWHRHDATSVALTVVVAGFTLLACLLHRVVHRLMMRSFTMQLRNGALVEALERDRARVESTNQALEEANLRLGHQAHHDALTGVLNRRGLDQQLGRFVQEAKMAERHVLTLFCDLDRFKVVNDSLGHAAGDRLLCTTSERIRELLPDTALLARLGGDEFVAVVSFSHAEPNPTAEAIALADRVREGVARPVAFEGREFVVTTTVGVAMITDLNAVNLDVLRQADRALHYAKDAGRNRVELFGDSLRHVLPLRVDEEHSVRTAIERGEIVPWYQPIVDAGTNAVTGAELLARWVAPDGRTVKAADFIDLARETGLLDRLSEVLVERALIDFRYWTMAGLPSGFRIGINLPPRFVSRTAKVDRLLELLAEAQPDLVTAEISETSVLDDLSVARDRLAVLREMGMLVALDDFGTGTASMSLLQQMPIDAVKIDRSFVADLGTHSGALGPRNRALVGNFVRLGAELGLNVTAEGVETRDQADALIDLGCNLHQGYLYAEAVDAGQLLDMIRVGDLRPTTGVA